MIFRIYDFQKLPTADKVLVRNKFYQMSMSNSAKPAFKWIIKEFARQISWNIYSSLLFPSHDYKEELAIFVNHESFLFNNCEISTTVTVPMPDQYFSSSALIDIMEIDAIMPEDDSIRYKHAYGEQFIYIGKIVMEYYFCNTESKYKDES